MEGWEGTLTIKMRFVDRNFQVYVFKLFPRKNQNSTPQIQLIINITKKDNWRYDTIWLKEKFHNGCHGNWSIFSTVKTFKLGDFFFCSLDPAANFTSSVLPIKHFFLPRI